ncbi:MAG: zinc-dependent metalloprotease, partial [Acidobacteria bacterium]|nr:zinc-dependent metalloprotease [Acidobacteriota bacterium]
MSQDPPPAAAQDPAADAGAGRGGRGGAAQAPRPYAQVVTAAFKTDDGVFKVHRGLQNGTDTLLFEIPKAELDKDFVWNVSIKKTTLGVGVGGQSISSRVVRWVKRGDRILLLGIDYSTTADPTSEVAQAVADANYPSIIRTMPVEAYAPNGDAVVNATAFFLDGVPEFAARGTVGGRGLAADRSFLERAISFPDNINVESTLTFTGAEAGGAAGGGRAAGGMRGSSGTIIVHHSVMKLPEKPMMPRHYDARVGFNTEAVTDFGTDEHRSVNDQIITRFRLEKKDANAAVSEPVKPIVFYVDPATPAKWVPFVKRGIESWQRAFEAAGFRNAILAKDAPANDAEWSAEDARHSIVRWVPTPTEAQSTIRDPRSGEILSASVDVYPNVATFGPTYYFVQAAPLDTRAAKLPLPDDVSGELIRFQVAHGVGHALGFPHNLKASSEYTVAQVRDPKWVKDMSFVPSIMDDARFNYVAQPEDNMDPADLIPKVGPYDTFAVTWGYKPVPSAKTPDQEKAALDAIVKEQETKSYLRFSTEGASASDPGENAEAVADSDAVAATTLGMKNLGRVAAMLFPATSTKVGDPW